MKRIHLALALLLVVTPVGVTAAQSPLKLGVAGGVSFPSADLSDGTNIGWNSLATVWLTTLMQPIGLRLDFAYSQFDFDDETEAVLGDGSQSISSGTLNLTYRLPMTNSPLSPYLITGAGVYRTDCSLDSCEGSNHFGWNAGLGTRINVLGWLTFVEARYHSANAGEGRVGVIPLTFGVLF